MSDPTADRIVAKLYTEEPDPFIAHDHTVYVEGCHRCELSRAEAAAATEVHWSLPLEDAEELWEFLHHSRPGGYQHVHDSLREAIDKS